VFKLSILVRENEDKERAQRILRRVETGQSILAFIQVFKAAFTSCAFYVAGRRSSVISHDETNNLFAAGNTTEYEQQQFLLFASYCNVYKFYRNSGTKMKTKLRICKSKVLSVLVLLRPRTESVIIRRDVSTRTGKTVYTARGIRIVNKTINCT